MRIVLDTGVIVSGLLMAGSMPRQAIDRARRATILFSIATLEELDEVLRRPKFNAYLPQELRLEFLAALIRESRPQPARERASGRESRAADACRPPADPPIVAAFTAFPARIRRHPHGGPVASARPTSLIDSPTLQA